ncbi:MAG: AAA family ATPase [Kiritimatiellae bacterium]|nr:AAA family ATPase [Kiritimatiellia bacterium]
MKRRYEAYLSTWFEKTRRKPLVIRGARQVGKSTLVRRFAEMRGLKLFEVNLERHPVLREVSETLDPGKILREVEFICNQGRIDPSDSLLFLDEVQEVPKLLQCLRYFYEEMPELPVIAAGSLLEFAQAEHSFPMPVGRVEYFYVGPVSWEEFLEANEEALLLEWLRNYATGDTFPLSAHEHLISLLRDYLLVGGMPEAVQLYVEGRGFDEIFDAQEAVYQTYRDDFSKYAQGRALVRLQKILDYLGQGAGAKVKYSNVDRESQSREIRQALELIQKAGVVLSVPHSHANGVPLASEADDKVFKLYCLDIGLYNRICRLEGLSERSLRDARFVNEGVLAEQFVAQQLFFAETPKRPPELYYWLREGRANNAEVDFLRRIGPAVIPVEVKAGKGGSLKSLFQFSEAKGGGLACRFDLNPPGRQMIRHRIQDREVTVELLSLPLYLCGQADRLLADALGGDPEQKPLRSRHAE